MSCRHPNVVNGAMCQWRQKHEAKNNFDRRRGAVSPCVHHPDVGCVDGYCLFDGGCMRDVIEMAREVGLLSAVLLYMYGKESALCDSEIKELRQFERFAELVRADEREAAYKRRGVLAFCPYTGRPRHPSDIASDPHGILILVPDQPIRAARSNT